MEYTSSVVFKLYTGQTRPQKVKMLQLFLLDVDVVRKGYQVCIESKMSRIRNSHRLKGGVRVCNFEKIDFFCLIL